MHCLTILFLQGILQVIQEKLSTDLKGFKFRIISELNGTYMIWMNCARGKSRKQEDREKDQQFAHLPKIEINFVLSPAIKTTANAGFSILFKFGMGTYYITGCAGSPALCSCTCCGFQHEGLEEDSLAYYRLYNRPLRHFSIERIGDSTRTW